MTRNGGLKLFFLVCFFLPSTSTAGGDSGADAIERGRYLVKISGCNDCHTAGYAKSGGEIPEEEWLKGDELGWRGPWGTTYAGNIRIFVNRLTADQWVDLANNTKFRPPMPWFSLRDMTDDDLRAMYDFINYLGPAGEAAPGYVPPDREPEGPYVLFP